MCFAFVDIVTIGVRKILFVILSESEGSSTRDMSAGQVCRLPVNWIRSFTAFQNDKGLIYHISILPNTYGVVTNKTESPWYGTWCTKHVVDLKPKTSSNLLVTTPTRALMTKSGPRLNQSDYSNTDPLPFCGPMAFYARKLSSILCSDCPKSN